MKIKKTTYISVCSILIISYTLINGCKKALVVPPPKASITTSQVFADSSDASGAVMTLYKKMIGYDQNLSIGSGAITHMTGVSSDELSASWATMIGDQLLYVNSLTQNDVYGDAFLWTPAYQEIYQANAVIEGVKASNGLSQFAKNQFTGEAEFFRALMHFYLVNLYGDVPLITTTNYQTNALLPRTPTAQVYQQIISDLKDAASLLPSDYSISGGQRIRVNKWGAEALLARVYLYTADYKDAISEASAVLDNPALYSLVPDLNGVFLANSSEAILQWNLNSSNGSLNVTPESYYTIPSVSYYPPFTTLSPQLLGAFEAGDKRKADWTDTITYSGNLYYYPYKYKAGAAQLNGPVSEYYMVLRLAELYLIRAEANAQPGGDLPQAISDLNVIRSRAGLPNSIASSQSDVLKAIQHEDQIEFAYEWGHRWFDLKRWKQIDAVMSVVTPLKTGGSKWNSYQQLYPIGLNELKLNPNLKQNPGY